MTIFIRLCGLLLIATATTQTHAGAQTNPMTQSDSVTVARLVSDWSSALKTKDLKELDRIMADDFITTNVDGSVNSKEQEIAPFRSPDLKFDTASLNDLSITIYGTTAIVRGSGLFTGKSKWGPFSSNERFTDVFLKRNGRWQAVSSHSSAMRKK